MTETKNSLADEREEKLLENRRLFNIVNPDTGLKYDIPMLSNLDGDYYFKYVYFMKMKEDSPHSFDKCLSWD